MICPHCHHDTITGHPAPSTDPTTTYPPGHFDNGYPGELEPGMAIQWDYSNTLRGQVEWSEWADVIALDRDAYNHPTAVAVAPSRDHRCVLLRYADGSERAMWFDRGGIVRIARRAEAKAWYAANLPGIDTGPEAA